MIPNASSFNMAVSYMTSGTAKESVSYAPFVIYVKHSHCMLYFDEISSG
jgi:hypothetical protein